MWENDVIDLYRHLVNGYHTNGVNSARAANTDELMYKSALDLMKHWKNPKEQKDESGLPLDFIPPNSLILINCMEMVAYLVNTYVYKNPLIPVPDLPNAMHVSQAVKDKLQSDALKGAWQFELIRVIQNAVFYNLSPTEILLNANKETTIKSLSVRNIFYDDVSPNRVHLDAMYAGYTEQVTTNSLYRRIQAVQQDFRTTVCANIINDVGLLEKVKFGTNDYLVDFCGSYVNSPIMEKLYEIFQNNGTGFGTSPTDFVDWRSIISNVDLKSLDDSQKNALRRHRMFNKWQLTTMYLRTTSTSLNMPAKQYAIYDKSVNGLPVYRVLILNHTVLLAVEPVTEQHGMLPIVVGQINTGENGNATLSYSENLAPLQVYVDKLTNARMAGLRRALVGKDIIDERAINEKTFTDNSKGVVVVNPHLVAEGASIDSVYRHVPYDASGVSMLVGMLEEPQMWADRISGNNAQMRGGRIKGNKLAIEAQQEASAAEGRFKVYSIVFQQTFMLPFKFILRSNLAESTDYLTYYDALTGTNKSVTLEEFQKNLWALDMADGAMPSTKTVSPDVLATLATMVIQIPELRMLKDLPTMISLLASAAGFEGFSQVPPPSMATMQRMQSMQDAQGVQPNQVAQTTRSNDSTGIPTQTDKQAALKK